MKIRNRRRGIYSEEERARKRGGKLAREEETSERERAPEGGRGRLFSFFFFFFSFALGWWANREATCVLATRLRRHVMLGLFRTWPLHLTHLELSKEGGLVGVSE